MSDSATEVAVASDETPGLRERKRHATRVAISDTARELTATEGFNNWTIEQLCEQVGVSRRTFFNYFPTKEDALVGHRDDDISEDISEGFLQGTGTLLDDLCVMMCAQAEQNQLEPRQFSQLREAISSDPSLLVKLLGTAKAREDEMAALIAEREGFAADDLRATVAATLISTLSYQSTERFLLAGNGASYPDILTGYIEAARSLFRA